MVFTANVFISLSYGSQKKVLRLTFFTPNDYFFVPFLGLTVNPFGNLHYVQPVFPFNNSKVSVSCRRKRSKTFLSTPAFPWCFYLSTLRQPKAIKRVGPGIENKTNLFMIPNFRPKIFCHLGQMLRLELEPITSSYFLLPFSKHLFSLVHGTKTERFKNYTFEKNYRFETVFESLHFHRTLYQIKYGFSQFRRSSNLWRNSESETFSKIVLRESYRIAFQSS